MSKAEKFIKDYTRNCSNEIVCGMCEPWLTPDQARRAVEIEREEMIKKSVKWLKDNIGDFFSDKNRFIKEYKQAMKNE